MRDGYGKALLELIAANPNVIALDADVAKSTRSIWVKEKFPANFVDMGIAEQDLVGTAAGLALGGMLPFTSTYAVFMAGRAWDEIRTTVCYNNLNVKIAGAHAGISVGPDGATHQALEDVALMRVLPNMTVVVPCDAEETRKATLAIAAINGPAYIRFGREAVPVVTDESTTFELGKARTCREGSDVAIFANGAMLYESLEAAKILAAENISAEVIDLHTVKPLDVEAVTAAAKKCGCVVTAEEHQIFGGMGSAVAECLAQNFPVPQEFIAINDSFGESGQPQELMDAYGLNQSAIVSAVKKVVARKN
ncbi:MAG: transketolase family protein [Selenomonadaceae bacterium]|nr:transketolase family protein [Selenomonadaceae bacterium]